MPSTSPEPTARGWGLTVLYDGAYPQCSREIAQYRRQPAHETIRWVNATRCADTALPKGVRRGKALRRFHVLQADGHTVTGAAAFVRLWSAYPARLVRLPSVTLCLEFGYRLFLRLRPLLTVHGRRAPCR